MAKFGKKSLERLNECHYYLQVIANELIKEMDVTILCGHRSEKEQKKAFDDGFSKKQFPHSKHNSLPSMAMDVAPYPVDWNNIEKFEQMCDIIERIAKEKGISVRMGRSFSFKDYPHVELV
jgi:hypothetical protein